MNLHLNICLGLTLLCGAAASLRAQPAAALAEQSIYQIFTDRFFDGDPANNNASGSFNASSGTGVHGGDFRGIEQKLDYIKALGATAIWLSPIVLNGNGEYHGYAGRNFYQVDPHWGTLADLQSMVNAAHAKGLLVIQDVVVNHGGTLVTSSGAGYPNFNYPGGYTLRYQNASRQYAAPFNTNASFPALNSLFHNYGHIQDYNNTLQAELGELSGLDDFRTELPYIRTNMAAVYQYWVQTAGFDGFRVDTVKHTEMGFWEDWCPRLHAFAATNGKPDFFMFGEVYDGNDAKCGSYTGTKSGGAYKFDSVLDFPLYFRVNSVFATASSGTSQLQDRYAALAANYDPVAQNQLITFLDNHDLPRFLHSGNANGNTNRLTVALVFQHTSRGVPCVYQGTEQAFNGGADPANREDMFDGAYEQGPSLGDNFNMTHPLFQLVAKLNNFRRLYPALRTGNHVNSWSSSTPGLFAYARRLGEQEVFVVFNTGNTVQVLPARPTIYPVGTTLVNLLDPGETVTVLTGSQTPTINVPTTTAKIFIAQSQWLPLDPVVAESSPAHDAASVPAATPLLLRFSEPMDTNSVQAAFSTLPVVTGSFAWSPAQDVLTFTPATSWAGLTLTTVRIADTARAASTTNRLRGAYELRFRTGSAADVTQPTASIVTPTNGSFVDGLVTISGVAADNISVTKVEVRVDTGAWLLANGTTSWSYALNTSNLLNGTHTLSARATDWAGNVSLTNSVTVRFVNVPGSYEQRIAAGNPNTVTNCDASVWLTDVAYTNGAFGYSGGTGGNVANAIIGVCASAQTLYQRERYSTSAGGFRYWFDVPVGVYETTLLEAETWWNAPGERLFNVFIEGQPVLTNFDILATAGGKNLPLNRTFTNAVVDGQLEIFFAPVVDNARVSGVRARKAADLYSDDDGIPDWWRLAYFDQNTGLAANLSRGEDDADGDGATNLHEFLAGTNPLDVTSVFKITSAVLADENAFALTCSAVPGRSYQLEQLDLLADADWEPVGEALAATEDFVSWPDLPATNSHRYFRVQVR